MSIIEKSNPLNLQYKICIVTDAASPLGTIVCKTLLKANALVLGVDSRPKDHSLNAGVGMHFQFEERNLSEAGTAEKIIEAVREKYRSERIDVLVNIVEEGTASEWKGLTNLSQAVGKVMAREGSGCIINVLGNVEDAEAIDYSRNIAKEHKGIRCNVIVPSKETANSEDAASTSRYKEANSHMTEIMNKAKSGGSSQPAAKAELYDIGNLTLFLAGDMSANIGESVVHLDGSYRPL